MKHTVLISLLIGIILCGCNRSKSPSTNVVFVSNEPPTVPYAELLVADEVAMGIFTGDSMKRQVDVMMENTGNDTLYIRNVLPQCDCTEIVSFDSIIPAGEKGSVIVSLDLTGYPADTIRKEIGILSNDRHERVKRVELIGICR